jgi:glucosamine-6-phosphate deaminase
MMTIATRPASSLQMAQAALHRCFRGPDGLATALAAELVTTIRAHAQDTFILGCPGGRSLLPTYRAIAQHLAYVPVDMSRVIVVMMDEYLHQTSRGFERCGAREHYSCAGFCHREIVEPINRVLPERLRIAESSVWVPDQASPADFERRLAHAGGIDVFLMACGSSDGHIGFNPPGSQAESTTRIVKLAETTRRDNLRTFPQFRSIAEVPEYGVTVGLDTLSRFSHRSIMVVTGAEKRAALKRLLSVPDFDPGWPASVIHSCRNASICSDEAAACFGEDA